MSATKVSRSLHNTVVLSAFLTHLSKALVEKLTQSISTLKKYNPRKLKTTYRFRFGHTVPFKVLSERRFWY